MMSWVVLLARLVTENHPPHGWTLTDVKKYLQLLEKLLEMLLEEEGEELHKNDIINIMAQDLENTCNVYSKSFPNLE